MQMTRIDTTTSPAADWLNYFTFNRGNRTAFLWERGVCIPMHMYRPLVHSLQRFQLGERGDGTHLSRYSAQMNDPSYAAAMELFIQEEQEHSQLLARVLKALNADLLQSHWSDNIFMALRRFSGLHVELLTLLIAEVIAMRYYRALAEGIEDPVSQAVFSQIVRDEWGHVAFHCDKLHEDFSALPGVSRTAIRLAWHGAFRAASLVMLFEHRAILRAVGVAPGAFLRDCNDLFEKAANEVFAD